MFIYINGMNQIFYQSEQAVRTTATHIYGPDQVIYKREADYTIIERAGEPMLERFEEFKYSWDPETETISYANPEDEIADKWDDVRDKRDPLLEASDKESLVLWADRWLASDQATKDAWDEYRTALRNITTQEDPDNVTWPMHPLELGGALNPEMTDSSDSA